MIRFTKSFFTDFIGFDLLHKLENIMSVFVSL